MHRTHTDILVVGAGPSGLAAALACSRRSVPGKLVLLELGRTYSRRTCPVDLQADCAGCGGICNVLSGFGGSIHYGDGVKLSRFPSGRRLADHIGFHANSFEAEALEYLSGPSGSIVFTHPDGDGLPFALRKYPVAVISSSQMQAIIRRMYSAVASSPSAELHLGTEVIHIEPTGSGFDVLARDPAGEERVYGCKFLLVGAGRAGHLWWRSELRRLGLPHTPPTISMGLRFECPASVLRGAAAVHADFKATFQVRDVKVKTFCFCAEPRVGGGRVKFTRYPGFTLLDGHVIAGPAATANFGLLIQLTDRDGFPRSFEWVSEHILNRYRHLRPDRSAKPVVQWYPDFRDKLLRRRTLPEIVSALGYQPSVSDLEVADLAALVADYHAAFCAVFETIFETLARLDHTENARLSADSFLVYGLELESIWDRPELSPRFESPSLPGLFVIGDCAGIAQGILQAMTTGIAAADALP